MPQPSVPHPARQKTRSARHQRPAIPEAPAPPRPAVLRTLAAARYIGLSESFLEKARITGAGPPFVQLTPVGVGPGAVGYLVADLDRWLAERRCTSTSAPSLPMTGASGRGRGRRAARSIRRAET